MNKIVGMVSEDKITIRPILLILSSSEQRAKNCSNPGREKNVATVKVADEMINQARGGNWHQRQHDDNPFRRGGWLDRDDRENDREHIRDQGILEPQHL